MTALLEVRTCGSPTARSRPSRASPSASRPARSSPSSAPTAPARPPPCARSPGLLNPSAGEITFDGKRLTTVPAHRSSQLGLAHSPEGRHIFPRLTIEENLLLGAFLRKDRPASTQDIQRAYDLFPILGERRKQAAGTLSGGEQQMLAMGRALMCQPKLLMLDEPSMGLSPIMMQKIMATIDRAQAAGHDDPAGRAERPGGPLARRPRATSWRSARSSSPAPGRTCSQRRRPQGLPRRGLSRLGRVPRAAWAG